MKIQSILRNIKHILYPAPIFCIHCEENLLHSGDFLLCHECYHTLLDSMKNTYFRFHFDEELRLQSCGEDSAEGLCVFPYIETTRTLIHAFKFSLYKDCAKFWADAVSYQVAKLNCTYIVPVPSSKKSIRDRGFSHIHLLAEELKKITSIPTLPNILHRNKDVKHQLGLKRQQRLENVKDIFECTQDLSNIRVLLLDDVLTTGATVYNCKLALEKKGASVMILTLAQA